jgi:hypothetical protein
MPEFLLEIDFLHGCAPFGLYGRLPPDGTARDTKTAA